VDQSGTHRRPSFAVGLGGFGLGLGGGLGKVAVGLGTLGLGIRGQRP
jgi:hypothetical protein